MSNSDGAIVGVVAAQLSWRWVDHMVSGIRATPGEWLLTSDGNELQLRREHAKGDAAVRGTAQALLLSLWGRRHRSPVIDVVGDPLVADAWLALGG